MDGPEVVEETRTKTYLLTGGLVQLFKNRHGLVLSQEVCGGLEEIERDYFQSFKGLLQGYSDNDEKGSFNWDVNFLSGRTIEESFERVVGENLSDRPLISFDDIYGVDLADGFYGVTRLMDPNDLSAGTFLGPRFGNDSLERQIEGIKKRFGIDIDIMDIGTFEGETIDGEIKKRFSKQGINIHNAYLVLAGEEGVNILTNAGLNLHFTHSYDWIDWLEIRDCMGLDGRKVAGNPCNNHVSNRFVGYNQNPVDWASIPPGFEGCFRELYDQSFGRVKDCLKRDGYELSLDPSSVGRDVYDLKIS